MTHVPHVLHTCSKHCIYSVLIDDMKVISFRFWTWPARRIAALLSWLWSQTMHALQLHGVCNQAERASLVWKQVLSPNQCCWYPHNTHYKIELANSINSLLLLLNLVLTEQTEMNVLKQQLQTNLLSKQKMSLMWETTCRHKLEPDLGATKEQWRPSSPPQLWA